MSTTPNRDAILGRILNADGAPFTPGESAPQPLTGTEAGGDPGHTSPTDVLETGIKVVDLFAPLRVGGLHQVSAGVGVGKDVLLTEIINNIGRHANGCAVWVAPYEHTADGSHMVQWFRESGVMPLLALLLARPGEAATALRTATRLARALALDGSPTLLGIESDLLDATTAALIPQADNVTRLIISHGDEATPLPAPLTADGYILFSRELAQQSIWPAVDPIRSASRLIARGDLPAEHLRLASAARDVLTTTPDSPRARRLLRFGTQPFTVAEAYTARPGAYVPLPETLAGYASILSGAWDDAPEEALAWHGRLPQRP